tara:strand:+ start:962 stop:1501 length:540 start_codon:yes stop_codon:yes gene_type:complete
MKIVRSKKKSKSPSLVEVNNILANIRLFLLRNPVAKEMCKEMGFEESILYGISISFSDDLDVAAKTVNSNIILNIDLHDEDFSIIMRYVIHELTHAFQHMKRADSKDPYDNFEYLDRPDELEAFQYQIEFDDEYGVGESDTAEYVEELMEYHDIDKEDKGNKREELLDKTDVNASINKN